MRARSALLIIDFINPTLGRGAGQFARRAVKAAQHTAALAQRARRARMPVIYANDHFGNWQSDFSALLEACRRGARCAREVISLLEPGPRAYAVLKPRHSAFYGTPLEFLLDELGVQRLVLTGIEADICVLCTAQDAHMRRLKLWVPRNCVASRSPARHAAALSFMRINLKADTRSSASA